jgi:hypothetical protein
MPYSLSLFAVSFNSLPNLFQLFASHLIVSAVENGQRIKTTANGKKAESGTV